jgi:hypothetical protein
MMQRTLALNTAKFPFNIILKREGKAKSIRLEEIILLFVNDITAYIKILNTAK